MTQANKINIVNRRAKFEFEFIEEFIAGIQLNGGEVKSIRAGQANLSDAFCYFRRGELFIRNFHIADYKYDTIREMDPTRERKLLLKRRELQRLEKRAKEKGLTIIPYRVFINDRGWIKIKIALAQGKKIRDKRQTIQERESKREIARLKKGNF